MTPVNRLSRLVSIALMIWMLSVSVVLGREAQISLREDFNDLNNWKPLTFPKIERHSEYVITLETASLAIMNDSDNTGEAAVSHVDFIEVRSSALKETSGPNP